MKSYIIILSSLFFWIACQEKSIETSVVVRALNEAKKPILNADIYINNQFEGKTNTQGYFQAKIKTTAESRLVVQVQKDSKFLYYAPYFENVIIQANQTTLHINAILYSVPKPSENEDSTSVEQETSPSLVEESVNATDIQPTAENLELQPDNHNASEPDPKIESVPTTTTPNVVGMIEKPIAENIIPTSPAQPLEPLKSEPVETDDIVSFYLRGYSSRRGKGGEIYLGDQKTGSFNLLCKVNRRGRCSVSMDQLPLAKAEILVKSDGYRTARLKRNITAGDKVHIPLMKGHSIDVQTKLLFNRDLRPLENISVWINDRRVGVTDSFGHFTSPIKGAKGDLIKVTLKSNQYAPATSSTDFVIGGNLSFTKHFTSKSIPNITLVTAPVQIAGKLKGKTLPTFTETVEQNISRALKHSLFQNKIFISKNFAKSFKHKNFGKILKSGWSRDDTNQSIYGIIIPTLVIHQTMTIELNIVGNDGKSLMAAKRELSNIQDQTLVRKTVAAIAKELMDKFPYPSYIKAKSGNQFVVQQSHLGITPAIGDLFSVTGTQSGTTGQSKFPAKGGLLRVSRINVKSGTIYSVVDKQIPRSHYDIGDALIYRGAKKNQSLVFTLHVVDKSSQKPIQQASVYFGHDWMGTTNQDGKLIGHFPFRERRLLRVIKHGYQGFAKETKIGRKGQFEIKLNRVSAFLRMDSIPSGMSVFVDKNYIGKTPINRAVAVPGGFVKLEILGQNGYKNFKKVIEFKNEVVDLTGEQAVVLEKDLKSLADQTIESGKIDEAIKILESIPPTHSDYLIGQHQTGIVYMTLLDQPSRAAAAFHKVTSHPEVKTFRDKRFIGSHINEGIALYLTGKNLEKEQQDVANAHYEKAIQVLEKTVPFLRHINESEYQLAFENLFYYKALSHQKIGEATGDKNHLQQSEKDWDVLLSSHKKSHSASTLLKNAGIYKKQLQLALKQKGE